MAVTVISQPLLTPNVISASYPAVFKLSSNIYGTANVTQFRFLAEIVSGADDLGTKFTVVSEDPNIGYIDVANTLRELLHLEPWQEGGAVDDWLTEITSYKRQGDLVRRLFTITIKEQYFLSGVFTENALAPVVIQAARGFSDDANRLWSLDNWYRFNGLSDFMPYSGKMPIVYPIRTDAVGWSAGSPYMNIVVKTYPGGGVIGSWWFDRTTADVLGVVYVRCYYVGITDQADRKYITIESFISTVNGSGGVLQETVQLDNNVTDCEDGETVLMFRDRFFQWSFMSFTQKHFTTTNTQPQRAEAPTGRYRYNVDASDNLLLNTDWVPEGWNPLFRDLIQTEECYLVNADATLEEVTIVPNSFRYQTSRNDGLIQYSISVRKSIDNFNA
jgi:hypothetical protein